MPEFASRANRRRRWWLRAQAALQALNPTPGQLEFAAVADPPNRLDEDWFERWRRDSRVPSDAQLQLVQRSSGQVLKLRLHDPSLLVGSSQTCQLQLQDSAIAPRQALLLWVTGRLALIDLTWTRSSRTPLVRSWMPGEIVRWSGWEAAVAGEFPDLETATESVPHLQVELSWDAQVLRLPTPIHPGLTLVGSAQACDVRIVAEDVALVHAAIIRTSHSVWVLDLLGKKSTRVNGRPIDFAPLDPGDVLGVGSQTAWLSVHWPRPALSPTPNANIPQGRKGSDEAWQRFLVEQSALLTQMQQRIADMLQRSDARESAMTSGLALDHVRRLAADCQQEAGQFLGAIERAEQPELTVVASADSNSDQLSA